MSSAHARGRSEGRDERVAVLCEVVAARTPWLGLVITDDQLLVDVSRGYDVLILGADPVTSTWPWP